MIKDNVGKRNFVDLKQAIAAYEKHDQSLTPPDPRIEVSNPQFEKWVERAGLILCIEAGEAGVVPTPCGMHLSQAREHGRLLRKR